MGKFINFDKMIAPIFIKLLFWIGFIGAIIFGLGMIGFGIIAKDGNFLQVLGGIISLFLGPIIVRIYCEMFILFFKMQELLVHIRDELQKDE